MRRAWVIVALLVLGTAPARAEERRVTPAAERQSRGLFERGEAHFKAGLFAEALAEYQSGYDLNPLPGFLINIAQCHRRMGHLDEALLSYRKFVMVAPDSRFVPQVKALIAELEPLVSAEAAKQAEAARQADDRSPAAVPGAAATAKLPEAPAVAQTPRPAVDLAAPATTAEPTRGRSRWWLWTGLAAVAAGAATAFIVLRAPETTAVHEGTLGTLRR